MSKQQSIKELTEILESSLLIDDYAMHSVATFTLAILHGKAAHKRWLLCAALNFIDGDDVYDNGNVFEK